MFIYYNPNPSGRSVGDCAIRAIAKALDIDWEDAYAKVVVNGFYREALPNTCPDCYTTEDFCRDNPVGTYVLGFGGHVATVVDGNLYDSWNSLNEVPQYYWYRKEKT